MNRRGASELAREAAALAAECGQSAVVRVALNIEHRLLEPEEKETKQTTTASPLNDENELASWLALAHAAEANEAANVERLAENILNNQ